jgi:hypothetical protein
MEVRSELGKGTTFRIALPLAEASVVLAVEPSASLTTARQLAAPLSLRVLVVDVAEMSTPVRAKRSANCLGPGFHAA